MIMKLKKYFVFFICLILFFSCACNSKKKEDRLNIQVEQLSSSLDLLLNDLNSLKKEVLKVNAKKPSIQRILVEADGYWIVNDLEMANSFLERGLRIGKDESALYLTLAHLRIEQGLNKESSAFASRGLLNKNASSWEILLLKIYSTND